MSCKDCLNRREFLAKSALAVAALAAVEGCGDGQFGPTQATSTIGGGSSLTVKLADFPDLANTGTLVRIPDTTVGIVRTGATTFVASSTICTHEGCDTSVRDNQFSCPCHESLFSATGGLLRGPATRDLDHFSATFDATADAVTIT